MGINVTLFVGDTFFFFLLIYVSTEMQRCTIL